MSSVNLKKVIDAARGLIKADLVLKGGKLFDLVTGEITETDIAIVDDTIIGVHSKYEGENTIDISGKFVVPGFIDTHLHIESSMVTPFEFEKFVLPRGITSAICDPHEIANVKGVDGIKYFLDASEKMLMNLFVQLSSCVPSSPLETSGSEIKFDDLKAFMNHPNVIGLAEMMNYPGVINKSEDVIEKLRGFNKKHIDGHAPLLSGKDLNAYISTGISTEHEASNINEAKEKLKKGLTILIREGSVSKDLESLSSLITERNSPFIAFCTDDRNPLDIIEQGHIDYSIRQAIKLGANKLAVYRAASYSAAKTFNLKDRGLIAPGWKADIAVLNSLEECEAELVVSNGKVISEDLFFKRKTIKPIGRKTVKSKPIKSSDLVYFSEKKEIDVIGIIPGKIITDHLKVKTSNTEGVIYPDTKKDIAKIAVIERHGKNGNLSKGFVKGFGFKKGAVASTVCHDHHNIVVAGVSDEDMAFSANYLKEIEGGFVVAENGRITAEIALPIAGLMSLKTFEDVYADLINLRKEARKLGITLEEPFLQLAFLALPVIPHLKITDMGMVDVNRFEIIE